MSEHVEIKTEIFDYKHVGGKFLALAAVGGLAFLLCLVWGYFDPRQFAFSYLFGFYFFFTICMGGLFWTLVHHEFGLALITFLYVDILAEPCRCFSGLDAALGTEWDPVR